MDKSRRRKTKIVCTIGPASGSPRVIEELILAGMNVARLNFSHGSHDDHLKKIVAIREISGRLRQPVTILQDLEGPRIRIGKVREGGIELKRGQRFLLTNRQRVGDERGVSISYPHLPREVRPGDRILLADGTIELRVSRTGDQDIDCRVIMGGGLTSHKGLNFPTRTILAKAFTKKDRQDLLFGIQNGVDLIGLSFVKEASDIEAVKKVLRRKSAPIGVIAKIERREALDKIDEILLASDGIMVARGDLGVETPIEKIPTVQKMLIRKANALGKPVITATQMLRSMVDHNLPTRAEVTDVVNAIYDGTDAIMLSEETAIGRHPIEAVEMMGKIAQTAEGEFPFSRFLSREFEEVRDLPQALSNAASFLAEQVGAVVIVTPTESGSTTRWVSRLRPRQPIFALSRNLSTVRNLNLCWGVYPFLVPEWKDTDDMLEKSRTIPKELGIARSGDKIIVIAGIPISVPGTTNLIKVEIVK
ncbi:MAG: pyruvate kinase [Thermodesulfobacteriota bacterium]